MIADHPPPKGGGVYGSPIGDSKHLLLFSPDTTAGGAADQVDWRLIRSQAASAALRLACRSTMEFNSKERFVKQIPVAWDAIVFIVNKDNPVDDISIEQVRQIYEGKITNWKQLGGNNAAIDLYVRKSPLSGVGYTLRELVFYDSDGDFTSRAHSVKSSGPAEKAVEKNPNAFTATGISSAHRRNVKLLKVNGTEPNFETIKSGSYILYRPLYLITKLVEKNPLVLDFIKYATSEEGMAVIRKTGTVPYSDALNLLSNQYRQNNRTM